MSPETTTRNPNLDLRSPSVAAAGTERWRANLGRETVACPRTTDWWTGRDPSDPACPGRRPDGTLRALPIPDLATCSRDDVRAYFENGWAITEALFAGLAAEESFYRPPYHGLRHPMVFYYVHPAALYVNKFRVAGLLRDPVDPLFEQLFETGVDEMSWDDLSKNEMEWPALSACRAYRRRAFGIVREVIDTHPGLAEDHARIGMDSPLWALFLGFEHERIHIETSSVLIRELPLDLVRRPAAFPPPHPSARIVPAGEVPPWTPPVRGRDFPENPLVVVPAGTARIGKDPEFPTFGWDNEYGAREAQVDAFAASRHLVTNGEFHEFVADGGYRDDRWWTAHGRRWRAFRNVKWPTFWVPCGPQGSHQFALRTVFDLVAMPWDWPAVVNLHEAKAFCAWKAARDGRDVPLRLVTEAEHVRLRAAAGLAPADRAATVAEAAAIAASDEIHWSLLHGSEAPVTGSGRLFTDVLGNVWHWCEDDFHPLDGFRIHPVYDDFSTPCFDGEHSMIHGGSFASAGDEATLHARFHFRPHFFQHAGFRVVDPLRDGNDGAAVRIVRTHGERRIDGSRASRLFAAFAPAAALVPGGAALPLHRDAIPACIRDLGARLGCGTGRALDVGSGPGGMAYSLAATYGEVVAADVSAEVVADGRAALAAGTVRVAPGEGAPAIDVPLDAARAARVSFRQTDASSLPAEFTGFDLVVLSGVLANLPSPKSCLGRLGGARGLVRPGGLVVVADAWRWDGSVTPRELWLSGEPGEIAAAAGPDFDLVGEFETYAVERPAPTRAVVDTLRTAVFRRTS